MCRLSEYLQSWCVLHDVSMRGSDTQRSGRGAILMNKFTRPHYLRFETLHLYSLQDLVEIKNSKTLFSMLASHVATMAAHVTQVGSRARASLLHIAHVSSGDAHVRVVRRAPAKACSVSCARRRSASFRSSPTFVAANIARRCCTASAGTRSRIARAVCACSRATTRPARSATCSSTKRERVSFSYWSRLSLASSSRLSASLLSTTGTREASTQPSWAAHWFSTAAKSISNRASHTCKNAPAAYNTLPSTDRTMPKELIVLQGDYE